MTTIPNPQTILIADDDPEIVKALSIRCTAMGFAVDSASDGVRALLKARRSPPALLILDVDMPGADGLSVCRTLSDPKYPRFPVVILTGRSSDADIETCNSLGATYCKKGENTWTELQQILSRIAQGGNQEPGPEPGPEIEERPPDISVQKLKVLLVDDDRDLIRALETRLRKSGLDIVHASNGLEAFGVALRERPNAIVTDYNMPEASGDYLLARLQSSDLTRHIPVIVVSGTPLARDDMLRNERHMKDVRGAVAYLRKPVDSATILSELSKVIAIPSAVIISSGPQ